MYYWLEFPIDFKTSDSKHLCFGCGAVPSLNCFFEKVTVISDHLDFLQCSKSRFYCPTCKLSYNAELDKHEVVSAKAERNEYGNWVFTFNNDLEEKSYVTSYKWNNEGLIGTQFELLVSKRYNGAPIDFIFAGSVLLIQSISIYSPMTDTWHSTCFVCK